MSTRFALWQLTFIILNVSNIQTVAFVVIIAFRSCGRIQFSQLNPAAQAPRWLNHARGVGPVECRKGDFRTNFAL